MLPALYDAGEQSVLLDRLDEAAWCFDRALALEPNAPRALRGLAQVHHLAGRPDQAREAILAAHRAGLDEAEAYTMLGQYCQAAGDFPAALAAFDRAIRVRPAHGPAWLRRALLRRPGDPPGPLGQLEALLAAPDLTSDQRATLGFAFGHEYDIAGDPDRAFVQYEAANAVRHAQYPGYAGSFTSADPIMAAFPASLFAARKGAGDPSSRPVFVVGMMRSGTTLVEQILACHSAVHGHGEMTDLRQITRTVLSALGPGYSYPGDVALVDAATLSRHAAHYLAVQRRAAPDASRSVDKMPHNFEYLGLVALLFPNARIIHCVRDPRDVCVSNYLQDFGPLNPFTYDLATLGRYHREQARLMAYWREVLPIPILEISYESLVADQERCSRELIAFLGLPWQDACLDFHTNTRPVFTKSLWQVRQPIFNTSIGRWRRYARHLGPLIEALG